MAFSLAPRSFQNLACCLLKNARLSIPTGNCIDLYIYPESETDITSKQILITGRGEKMKMERFRGDVECDAPDSRLFLWEDRSQSVRVYGRSFCRMLQLADFDGRLGLIWVRRVTNRTADLTQVDSSCCEPAKICRDCSGSVTHVRKSLTGSRSVERG